MATRSLPFRPRSQFRFGRFVVGTVRLAGACQGPLGQLTGRAVCPLTSSRSFFPGVPQLFFRFFRRAQCPPKTQAFPRARSVSLLCPWDIFIFRAKKELLVRTACFRLVSGLPAMPVIVPPILPSTLRFRVAIGKALETPLHGHSFTDPAVYPADSHSLFLVISLRWPGPC